MSIEVCKYFDETDFIKTSHITGLKKVFISSAQVDSKLTQVSYGKLLPGEIIEEHFHASMEEFFYFIKGSGVYIVNGTEITIRENTFIYIPARAHHQLICNNTESLEFVYFGVAVEQ